MQNISNHAVQRGRQRGIRMSVMELVRHFADKEVFIGGGAVSCKLSRETAEGLIAEGLDPALVDAARKVCLVESDGVVVTQFRERGHAGRRYRRQYPTRKSPTASRRMAA